MSDKMLAALKVHMAEPEEDCPEPRSPESFIAGWRSAMLQVFMDIGDPDLPGSGDRIAQLQRAVAQLAATNAWLQFGECRAFDQYGVCGILTAREADDLARRVLGDPVPPDAVQRERERCAQVAYMWGDILMAKEILKGFVP